MQQHRVAWWCVVALLGCGGSAASAPAGATSGAVTEPSSRHSQTWVLVTVDSARIAATMSSGQTWDPEDTSPSLKDTAENLASLLSFATAEGGMVAQALASLIPQRQPDSDVTLPDARVTITHHENATNRQVQSARVIDSRTPSWRYAFFTRIDALRDRGLEFEVLEDDDTRQERVGIVSVPRSLLAQVAQSGIAQSVDLQDGALEQLRVHVEPVVLNAPSATQRFVLPLRQGLIATHLAVPRGAIVTARVSGQGRVGEGGFLGLGCPTDASPAGLPGGVCRNHNLAGIEALAASAHGSAIALIGAAPDLHAISLAQGDSATPCVTFAAPASGEIVLATNDRDSSDNSGEFTFEISVSAPPEPPTEVSESPSACQ